MRAAGRLIEHFSGFVGSLGLARDFGDDSSFEHVRQNETGMVMRLADASGRHGDLADGHLPAVHSEVGKIVFKDLALSGLPLLSLGVGGFSKQNESGGESIATSSHDI